MFGLLSLNIYDIKNIRFFLIELSDYVLETFHTYVIILWGKRNFTVSTVVLILTLGCGMGLGINMGKLGEKYNV